MSPDTKAVFPCGCGRYALGVMLYERWKTVREHHHIKADIIGLNLGTRPKEWDTYYSSSSSRGKLHVVSSSRRLIGRPRRMDMDLSARSFQMQVSRFPLNAVLRSRKRMNHWTLTVEEQPEGSSAYLALN